MLNPIKQIYAFNHKTRLVNNGYNDQLESSMIIEEALEGLTSIPELASCLKTPLELSNSPTAVARRIVTLADQGDTTISNVDRLDKACDQVVIAIGSMVKLGLNVNQITSALNIVMAANNAKVDCPVDSEGKLTKPDGWEEKYAPEPKLKALLNQVGN